MANTLVVQCSFRLPDTSGSVYAEPAAINLQSNDRYPNDVIVFADTSTRIGIGFQVRVPKNYVGTPVFIVEYSTVATSGNYDWEIDYRAIADTESMDPSTDQENLRAVAAAPGTARLRAAVTLAATGGNFAADDLVMGTLFRDGADADTISGSLYVWGLYFSYADA